MADIQTEEGWHTLEDGHKLYTKTWKTNETPKARMVFVHGFSDHCNAYNDFFPTLASRGIQVHAFDQRGWGRSVQTPKQKGLTGPTSTVLADITSFIKPLVPSPQPLFLFGHSMGGAEVAIYTAQGDEDIHKHIRGYILDGPFIAIHPNSKPSAITVALGRVAGRLLPHRQMVNKLNAEFICRDVKIQKQYEADPLCHDTGTLEGLAGMLDRAAELDGGKVKVPSNAGEGGKTRILIGHGTSDLVCDVESTKKLYERMGDVEDKELKLYDGWYHQLHAEPSPDKETYVDDVVSWIMKRVEPSTMTNHDQPTLKNV
ncbi:hypothetical protein E2P81_ATG05612 [Venturia nashicola]|nr:hypothetical protein E2P81_ATG05612 [Venturia nashicola]